MRIVISGSSGLIGSALAASLSAQGHEIVRLVRRREDADTSTAYWDPAVGAIETSRLEGADAVVHLAGESIATGRWSADKKRRIRDSRVDGTRLLSEALADLDRPPSALVSASAIGYYGDRGDEVLTERSELGRGFLAEVGAEWEAVTGPAKAAGIRVVNLRIGIVLASGGGALSAMLPVFRLGLGGPLGRGTQYMSWIEVGDLVRAIEHVLDNEELEGPVNAVSPMPVTNRAFTRTLGRVLGRPVILFVPSAALRLAFGEMAEETLLASARVSPERLVATGFSFHYPELEGALRHVFGARRILPIRRRPESG